MAVALTFKNGLCDEAINYYCNVFDLAYPEDIIRYRDFAKFNHPPKIRDRIYNSHLDIYGNKIYLYDVTNDDTYVKGNNIKIVIETDSDKLYMAYINFKKDSNVTSEPQKLDNKLFTSFVDKYDISWQFIAEIID